MDFSKTLIRCSSLGDLFTDPKLKEDKLAGNLSETAKSSLIRVYASAYWGRERELDTKEVKKGNFAENAGIELLGKLEGQTYTKNTERKSNDYITGMCDIDMPILTTDTKMSWDADTFLPQLTAKVDKGYWAQCQGYMWLWGTPRARVSYCLVDTPEELIVEQEMWLLKRMNVMSEESPEYIKAAKKLRYNMTFGDIPIHERVISHYFDRDEDFISQIPAKVKRAREFLQDFHQNHISRNLTPQI